VYQQALSMQRYLLSAAVLTISLASMPNKAFAASPDNTDQFEKLERAAEEHSKQLTEKAFSHYQQTLYYLSQETPAGALAAQAELSVAEQSLRQAIREDNNNVRASSLLGEVLALAEQPRKAIGAFNYALRINPKYYIAWLHRAKVLLNMGLLDDVKRSYVVLFRSEPELAAALMGSIDAWIAQRQDTLLTSTLTNAETHFMEWRLTKDG